MISYLDFHNEILIKNLITGGGFVKIGNFILLTFWGYVMLFFGLIVKRSVFQTFFLEYAAGKCITDPGPVTEDSFYKIKTSQLGYP